MIIEEFTKTTYPNWRKTAAGDPRPVNDIFLRIKCDKCYAIHDRQRKHYNNMKEKKYPDLFVMDYCNKCWNHILRNRPEYKKKLSEGVRKFHETEDAVEYRQNISKFHKGRIVGDKNPMKRLAVRRKVSETRSKLMEDPNEREKYVQGSINAHARDVYIGVDTSGRCKWFDYTHSNGTLYKVQGTWELKFIEWLDNNDIEFTCHVGRLPYKNGKWTRNYYPDFNIPSMGGYVDVKSDYWAQQQKVKWALLDEQYPGQITILNKRKLNDLGINV